MADCPESGGWHESEEPCNSSSSAGQQRWSAVPDDSEPLSPNEYAIDWYIDEVWKPAYKTTSGSVPTEEELIEALGHLRAAAAMLRDRADMELAVSKALTYGTLPLEIAAYLTLEAE